MVKLPNGLISFGKNANCTLELCPLESSILQYQPSIPGNGVIIGAFALAMLIHIFQGFRWRTWDFMICMIIGCLDEIIGYVGRILLHSNPFSFNGFLIQIVCITTAPVFFCSAIYVLLTRTINHLDRSVSRFNPKFFVWFFIPCDIVSLILQAAGGALSATQASSGNKTGERISIAGLVLQVATLVLFIGMFIEYVVRYVRKSTAGPLRPRMKLFLSFLLLSTILILVRCIYRIDELKEGYNGPLIRDEPLFMILESAMIVLAAFCLNVAHPGMVFGRESRSDAELSYHTDVHGRPIEPKYPSSSE